jgi:transcriptional regulator with XRE-family HTH domain
MPDLSVTNKPPKPPKHPDEIDRYIGARIRLRRQILQMSQGTLATRVGITFQQIQKYEKGINRIGSSRLFEIATVLGVPVFNFYQGLDPMAAHPAPLHAACDAAVLMDLVEGISSKDVMALCEAYLRIPNDLARKSILRLIQSIASEEGDERPADYTGAVPSESHI